MIEACSKPQLPPPSPPVARPPAAVPKVQVRAPAASSKRKILVKIILLSEAAVGM
jgi:hypothetical protein